MTKFGFFMWAMTLVVCGCGVFELSNIRRRLEEWCEKHLEEDDYDA